MQISLKQIDSEVNQIYKFQGLVNLDEVLKDTADIVRLGSAKIRGIAKKQNQHLYQVEVDQQVKATVICSKCLREFPIAIASKWSAEFSDVPLENDEQEVHLAKNQTIDLLPHIREAFLLELPYAPVCQENCQGLCPVCGKNRNLESCQCQVERIDPRLSKLKDLLKND